jgi:hypothetical protein
MKVHSVDSKDKLEKVVWPFVKGYSPTKSDWEELGFAVGGSFDNCFAPVPDDYMFKDWVGKDS